MTATTKTGKKNDVSQYQHTAISAKLAPLPCPGARVTENRRNSQIEDNKMESMVSISTTLAQRNTGGVANQLVGRLGYSERKMKSGSRTYVKSEL